MEALIALAGVAIGAILGGTGKYWSLRRDAWKSARTSGLLLLADVRALCNAKPSDPAVATTRLGITSWTTHRESLADFRRGNFPSGFWAPGWLALASHFARLEKLSDESQTDKTDEWWSQSQIELAAAEALLRQFAVDPPVFGYVVRNGPRTKFGLHNPHAP